MATHLSKITVLQVILIIVIGLVSSRGHLSGGFVPTHDAEYHIVRVWQFGVMADAGHMFPRWAPDLDWGYGVPLLMFFYPLPNYIAYFFTLFGATYVSSVMYTLAAGLVVSGISFYVWMREHVSAWPAFVARVSYMLAPYHLVDVLIRGSVGEVWALAIIPFVLWTVSLLVRKKQADHMRIAGFLAIFVAFLLLSHNIVGLMGVGFSLVYAVLLGVFSEGVTPKTGVNLAGGFVSGALITSFYYIPVVVESTFVRGLQIVHAPDHFPSLFQLLFPSWGSGFSMQGISDGMSFQIGAVHIVSLAIICFAGIIIRDRMALCIAWFTVAVCYIMLPFLSWVWDIFPFLSYMQYPWRLLSIVIIGASFCVGILAEHKTLMTVPLIFIAIFVFYGKYTDAVVYDYRDDAYYLSNPVWSSGTATLANTFGTRWSAGHTSYPESDVTVLEGEGTVIRKKEGPVAFSLSIHADTPLTLQIPVNYYPGWQALLDGKSLSLSEHDGLLALNSPAGRHSIIVWFGQTPVRITATIISVIGAAGTLMMMFGWSPYEYFFPHRTTQ